MPFTFTFIHIFLWGLFLISPILLMLFAIIIILGLIVSRIESWSRFDALYWAFITALTVGYGDIRPLNKSSRILSVLIACLGIMLTGILVAITVKAVSNAFEIHVDPEIIKHITQDVK
ncbi:potassium channel family protein [Shewanella surugensis]|uniref:Potassium channel family protein n=1 Tax=Shewanella surugensis TaxID=212020 RepID=A0ABT0LFS7_9GAMM|nr:potassium channel family protein [Shewanella surugensis]MCL1126515.1 potassium channel family protein [Shewanella surugensis]